MLKYSSNTYIRHAKNESLLWHKRNSACMILQDAEVFLRAISFEPRTTAEIKERIAEAFEVESSEIDAEVQDFLQNLLESGFIEADGSDINKINFNMDMPNSTAVSLNDEHDENWTPLGSFFESRAIPSQLHIDLTSACTERCIHCYIPDYANRFLPFAMVKKVLDEFVTLGGLEIQFSGGECMMHPDFAKILRYTKSKNLNMLILSNLTLCDEKMIKLLKEIDPQFVNVSLYSMDATKHDSITTIQGSWKKTMAAIQALKKAGVHIRLAAPIMKNNCEGFGELAEFAKQNRMHLIPDYDLYGQTDHDRSNLNCALNALELKKALRENKGIFDKNYNSLTLKGFPPDAKVCDIGEARLNIDSQGNYYPCDGCHGYILGNAQAHTLSEVWHGEKMEYLRQLKNLDFPECVECVKRPFCKVCPTRNFNDTGDLFTHAPERCKIAQIKQEIYTKKGNE